MTELLSPDDYSNTLGIYRIRPGTEQYNFFTPRQLPYARRYYPDIAEVHTWPCRNVARARSYLSGKLFNKWKMSLSCYVLTESDLETLKQLRELPPGTGKLKEGY